MKKHIQFRRFFLLSILIPATLMVASCSKNETAQPDQPNKPDTQTPTYAGSVPLNTVIRVNNLHITEDDPKYAGVTPNFYFSLENNKIIDEAQQRSTDWDVAFSGIFNSFLEGNNGANKANKGYSGGGNGGITILPLPFDQVTTVPKDEDFKTGSQAVGSDDAGAFGSGTGWYLYDYGGTIRGGGIPEKKHVAYALPETRTIIVRTAKGNYAKIRILSCYKDVLTADKMFKDTPKMFITFDYIMVAKGSTKF